MDYNAVSRELNALYTSAIPSIRRQKALAWPRK